MAPFVELSKDDEIVPDDRAEEVGRENRAREHARSMVQLAFGSCANRDPGDEPDASALRSRLVAGVLGDSRALTETAALVAAFGQQIGGEDPLNPEVRKDFEHCRSELAQLRTRLGIDLGENVDDYQTMLDAIRRFTKPGR